MSLFILDIEFSSYWSIGTGKEAGAYADSICLKDSDGLPYIPGKTLKGLFRTAFNIAAQNNWLKNITDDADSFINALFGVEGINFAPIQKNDSNAKVKTVIQNEDYANNSKGKLFGKTSEETISEGVCHFTNAVLSVSKTERDEIIAQKLQSSLYQTIQSTKIEAKTRTAENSSLRSIEVCVPVKITGNIDLDVDKLNNQLNTNMSKEELTKVLQKVVLLITEIGGKRRRGLGLCKLTIKRDEE